MAESKRSETIEEHLARIRPFFENAPFAKTLGIQIDSMSVDEASVRLPWAEHLGRTLNVLHGGAIAALIDLAAGVAALSDFEKIESLNAATLNLLTNYLSAGAPGKDVIATGRVRKRGRSIVVVDVDIEDAEGKLIATGTATYKMGTKVGKHE
ncbi:MAG: PaaI family thioesterase [Chrysiogenetes bacterium]|nr:PaaI family thioesterase [Chrysiogenetes bacterium]